MAVGNSLLTIRLREAGVIDLVGTGDWEVLRSLRPFRSLVFSGTTQGLISSSPAISQVTSVAVRSRGCQGTLYRRTSRPFLFPSRPS